MPSDYVLLGRSGLRVSRLSLGTMTFGTKWGWGSVEETARQIFDRYFDLGGNFIDTAEGYTGGTSEQMIGKFLKARGDRQRAVIATKFTFAFAEGDANGGGNGRKNILRAVEGSLRRLQTDFIDLYWLHAWDCVTPMEEVLATLHQLVASGKVRYIGFSNVPGWYLGRAQTIAEFRGWERVCAIQMEYSLAERNIEFEYVPAALELGVGIVPWSPLASGLLTGKYRRGDKTSLGEGEGRLQSQSVKESPNPNFTKLLTEQNWKIVEEVAAVAKQLGRSPAQVALNWVANRPGVASTIIGATKIKQLDDNMAALDFTIPPELAKRLAEVSAPEVRYPYHFFGPVLQGMIHGGATPRPTTGIGRAA